MDKLSMKSAFDAEDQKVYRTWLKRSLSAYGAMMFCAVAAIALHAMTSTATTTVYLSAAVASASP